MNLTSWMTDTINVASPTNVNNAGELEYGTPRQVKCRVEHKLKEVVSADGQKVLSDHEIAVLEAINIDDIIWLPGKNTIDATQARKPHNIHEATDKFNKTTMWMVFL